MKLFSPSIKIEHTFILNGFKNWSRGKEKLTKHQGSRQHVDAKYKTQEKTSIATQLDRNRKVAIEHNRTALMAIITTLKYLAKQGLARGITHDEGNFQELLKLRANDIPCLKTWLARPKSFTSSEAQNEILKIMSHKILRKICSEIREAHFYSLMVDETTDASTKEQVTICIRTVDDKLNPYEHFMGLYETDSTTGETISKIVLDSLLRFELSLDNLRGQCYDGGSNMKGRLQGAQSRILQLQPRAIYVHCLNHSLNLALQDSMKKVQKIRDTLQYANDASVLLGKSAKRYKSLKYMCS